MKFNVSYHMHSLAAAQVTIAAKENVINALLGLLSHNKDVVRVAAAHAMSSIAIHLQDSEEDNGAGADDDGEASGVTLNRLIISPLLELLEEGSDQWQLKHGVSRALGQCCCKVQGTASQALANRYLDILTCLQGMIKEGLNKNVYLQIYGCEGFALVCKAIRKNEVSTLIKSSLHTFIVKGGIFSTLIEVRACVCWLKRGDLFHVVFVGPFLLLFLSCYIFVFLIIVFFLCASCCLCLLYAFLTTINFMTASPTYIHTFFVSSGLR